MSSAANPYEDMAEMPAAPEHVNGAAEGGGAKEVTIHDEVDAAVFDSVPKMGDPIPAGTRVFRLGSYKEQESDEGEPFFAVQWVCQEEPFTGRILFDNVPWARKEDLKDASDPKSPRQKEAQAILNNRLGKSKAIMEAAGFKPSGKFGFKAFLASNPEIKIQYTVAERKARTGNMDSKGRPEFKGTGEPGNKVQKYMTLFRAQ